jgi:hypothetical protein
MYTHVIKRVMRAIYLRLIQFGVGGLRAIGRAGWSKHASDRFMRPFVSGLDIHVRREVAAR